MVKFYGTLFNFAIVIAGSLIGFMLKKGIPKRVEKNIMDGMALCVMYIGISGAFDTGNVLIPIISMGLGGLIGGIIDIDKYVVRLGDRLERSMKSQGGISQGFVTATLLFCVGAMAIVGSIESGLSGDNSTLYAKAWIDGIVSIVLTSSLGIGVIFAAVPVLLYQGAIALLAGLLQPVLTESIINEMSAVGSLLIVALSVNMLKLKDIKVMNFLPAIFLPILICRFFS